jgi:hypothetical protein
MDATHTRSLPALSAILLAAVLLGVLAAPAARGTADPPAQSVPAPLDAAPFGVNSHLATRYWDLETVHVPAEIVAQSGAGWAREDIHWFRIQPAPGVWDWSFTDAALRELIRREIQVVAVIGHPPGWATPFGSDAPAAHSFYAPDPQQFAAFAQAVVRRYGQFVHHWEIWNEPDNPLFWKPAPDPHAYARLLQLTAAAIRSTDLDAKLLLGGVNPLDGTFLREVAAFGAWESFDILAIHPYVSPAAPEAGNIADAVAGVRAVLEQYGAKPIWATEVGWSSGPGDRDPVGVVNEQSQADYLVRATLLLWRAGVERIFWYTLKDDPGNPYGLVAQGAGYEDYSRLKPSYFAFQTFSQQLGGASFVGLRDVFRRTTVLDFEHFGAWRRGDQPFGQMTPSEELAYRGRASARLAYAFPSAANEFVVFRRERGALVPGTPYAVGAWVYGDGSGNTLKIWLRDGEGEVLQYTLGAVGPAAWRFMQVQVGGLVPAWNRITEGGNGRLDPPVRVEAIVLDDAPDSFSGAGVIFVDDVTALAGPEAYNLQLQSGAEALDVLWAPTPVRASIRTSATSAVIITRDGLESTVAARDGRIELDLGPAPVYVRHQR